MVLNLLLTFQAAYKVVNDKYKSQLTDKQKQKLKAIQDEKSKSLQLRVKKLLPKRLGRPARPCTAFLLFKADERSPDVKYTRESYRSWIKELANKYKHLDDDRKAVYADRSKKLCEQYQ